VKIQTGIVTASLSRGFAFIRATSGEVFFARQRGLSEGEKVSFCVEASTSRRMPTATDVLHAHAKRQSDIPAENKLTPDDIAALFAEGATP
jgi:cold shock CspA family protein